ncbi:MAG: hypothetical protein QM698_08270 [Micropepsaceae bacterium]
MRLTAFAIAAALIAAPSFTAPARADAIPMPEALSAEQVVLIGVWQEEKPLLPEGLGHWFIQRTLAFGNDEATILEFGGIAPSNSFSTAAKRGKWTARRQDDKTLLVTLDQGEGRGTVLTLVFEGDDAFVLSDAEMGRFPPARFTRVGKKLTPYTP